MVLNFWATWCAPCRAEMPSLDRLQAAMPEIAVVPVATGRNAVTQITKFYEEAAVKNLPVLRDPKSGLAHAMGVMGLPVTVILDPEGREVARLIGDAEWDSDSAKAGLAEWMKYPRFGGQLGGGGFTPRRQSVLGPMAKPMNDPRGIFEQRGSGGA